MATYGIIPHRLIPGVSGVPADAENLSVVNTNAGGFGVGGGYINELGDGCIIGDSWRIGSNTDIGAGTRLGSP